MQMTRQKPCTFPRFRLREMVSIYFTMVAVFLLILLLALQGTTPTENSFPYKVPLDPENTLMLSWNVTYPEEMVYFQILVKKLKFGVLFGMSDWGEFEDADLAVLWSDGHNSYFADAWSDQKGQLHMDSQQDYQLLKAHNTPEGFYLLFKRPFNTCDPKDYLIEDGTVHLIYGFLEKPFHTLEAINVSSIRKGLQRVQLLKPNIILPNLPADVRTMAITAPHVIIPSKETTYWCYIVELPSNFPKHHIVMYEPTITKGNEAIVHHIELFQCAPEYDIYPHYSGPCDSKMKPERLNFCRHVLAAWAMGAQEFPYPEDVGLAFGGAGSRSLRLEVHYHNPLQLEGRRDSSGILLHYTPTLRKYDAGIMELGLVYTPVMAIPPQQKEFVLSGYCTEKCTQMALPPDGIHIFASQLHTHLTGKKVVTVLIRNGKEIGIVNQDNHYSPHFQGDLLITSCTYNTEDRDKATVGGFSILEEMCVNYVHYYPLTRLELCKSTTELSYLQKYFHLINMFDDNEVCTCPQASVTQQFSSVHWTTFSKDVLKALYSSAPISMHCNQSSAVRFSGEWEKQPLPKISKHLPEPFSHCQRSASNSASTPIILKAERQHARHII